MMAIVGFTNTQAPLPPPTAPYNPNNNVVVSPLSFFYGGAITDHIGAFQQVTWNAPPAGGFGTDPFAAHTWTWDNTDIRYADSTRFGPFNVTYGITANNNPTVQDPWNTTPAWGFPLCGIHARQWIRTHSNHRRRFCSACRQCGRVRVYRPVTKRAMMTMVRTCIVPCTPTTKKKLPITRLILARSGSGRRNWMQTHKLVGSR